MRWRWLLWLLTGGQRAILLAEIVLMAIGIVCLYLSDKVVTRWWQDTLDAFGVGFIVGGAVDVLAISVLDQTQRRRANDVEARLILSHWTDADPEAAEALLERAGR